MLTTVDERLHALAVEIKEAKQRGLDPTALIEEHKAISQGRRERRKQQRATETSAGPELRVISSLDEFRAVGPQWEALLLDSDVTSPFLTQAWLAPWLETFASRYTLHLAIVSEGERLVAAAPLMLGEERNGLHRGAVARFAGTGAGLRGNYFSFPMLPQLAVEAAQILRDHLYGLSEAGQVLELEHLSPFRDGLRTMELLFGQERHGFTIDTEWPCIHGRLPGSFEEFVESVPAASRRARLRHADASPAGASGLGFQTCQSPAELEVFLHDMATFNAERRHREGQVSTWEDPRNMSCRRAACEAFLSDGMLRFDRLLLGGSAIAALVGLVYKNTYFCYNMGFEPDYSRHEPGHVLLAHRLRACIDEGLARFDFLVGEADFKRQYFRDSSPELTLTCLPRKGRVRLLYGLRRLISAVRGKP